MTAIAKTGSPRHGPLRALALAAALAAGLAAALAAGTTARAQDNVLRIAAVVNGDVISVLDLNNRLRLTALSSGLEMDAETQQRLLPQVMRTMIDETLQRQAAEAENVRATDREIEQRLEGVAGRNNMSIAQMERFFRERNIDPDTLRRQIEAQVLWAKYVQRKFGREVRIGEEQIDEELARLRRVADKPQHRVYEIFLSVDDPGREDEVRQNAQRLLEQIRNGADFSSLARNFSQSPTAAKGGDLGWVLPGQLEPELDEAVRKLEPGRVSKPIRTVAGFYLLYVTDERVLGANPMDAELDIAQVTVRPPDSGGDSARTELKQELAERVDGVESCDSLAELAESRPDANLARADGVRLGDLPEPVREAVDPLDPGNVTAPIDRGGAIVVVGVCDRSNPETDLPSRDEIAQRLRSQRLDLRAQRALRDLRREAYVDVRL